MRRKMPPRWRTRTRWPREAVRPARSAGFLSEPGAAVAAPVSTSKSKSPRCRLRPGGNGADVQALHAVQPSAPAGAGFRWRPAAMGGACGATPRLAAAGCTKACRPRRWRFRSTTSRRTGHEHAARPRLWSFHATPQARCRLRRQGRSRFVVEGWPCPRQGTGRCSRHAGSRVGHFSIRDRAAPASLSCCESWRWRGCAGFMAATLQRKQFPLRCAHSSRDKFFSLPGSPLRFDRKRCGQPIPAGRITTRTRWARPCSTRKEKHHG